MKKNTNNGQKQRKKNTGGSKPAPAVQVKTTGLKKMVHVSPCASDYARSLANPISGPLACIPSYPAQLTKKFRVWTKGVFSTQSSNGWGYIAASPRSAVANDRFCINATGSASVQPNNVTLSAAVQNLTSNSEYTVAQIGVTSSQLQYRVVSSCLRIRYIGTELNRGGQIVGFQDPNHDSLFGRTISDVDGEEWSKRFANIRDWVSVLYKPQGDSDLNFKSTIPTNTPAATDENVFFMGILVQTDTSVSFEFEFYTTFEVYGKNVRAMTHSGADAVGFQAVHAVTQLESHLKPTTEKLPNLEKRMVADTARYIHKESSHAAVVPASTTHQVLSGLSSGMAMASNIWNGVESLLDFFF